MGKGSAKSRAEFIAELKRYKRLLKHVMRYKTVFFLGLLFMVILAATEPLLPALTEPFLNGTFVDKDPRYLFWAPVGLVIFFMVRGIANFFSTLAFSWITTKVVYDIRCLMFDRLLVLPTKFYDHNNSGKLISKVIYDVAQVTEAGTQVLTVAVKDGVIVIGLIGVLLWMDWQLSLMVLILIPAAATVAYFSGKRLRRLSKLLQASFGGLTHILGEATRGHRIVKIFGGQDNERSRFEPMANWVRRYQVKERVTGAAAISIVEVFAAITMAMVIWIGTSRGTEDELTVGGFVSFILAFGLLSSPIKRLTKINEPLQKGLAAAESVFALIDEPGEPDRGAKAIPRAEGRIAFKDVRFRYHTREEDAVGGVSFEVPPRQTVALVGSSGSGKTTVANLIPRLYELSGGQILLDGDDIGELTLAELRRQLTYVGQEVILFNDTVRANIAYGIGDCSDAEIKAAADAAFATEFIEKLPEGFDTEVGDNGVRLSGGQRQRLAIARALLKDAPVLILDEATSALDTQSEREVQRALDVLQKDRTTLVIAHRLTTVENADRIIVMDQGQIVESGTHAELLAQEGAYFRLHSSQNELN